MDDKLETEEASQAEARRRARLSDDLEEAIRSLIDVHTAKGGDGTITVRWGALPEDDPRSYRLYREAWARLAEALEEGTFHQPPHRKTAAE